MWSQYSIVHERSDVLHVNLNTCSSERISFKNWEVLEFVIKNEGNSNIIKRFTYFVKIPFILGKILKNYIAERGSLSLNMG